MKTFHPIQQYEDNGIRAFVHYSGELRLHMVDKYSQTPEVTDATQYLDAKQVRGLAEFLTQAADYMEQNPPKKIVGYRVVRYLPDSYQKDINYSEKLFNSSAEADAYCDEKQKDGARGWRVEFVTEGSDI